MKAKYLLVWLISLLCSVSNAKAQKITLVANLGNILTNDYRIVESVEMNGSLYFSTIGGVGTALWKIDAAGTVSLVYYWPCARSEYALNKLYVLNNQLICTGIDSVHGKEPWVSDGTAAGTHILKDIYVGAGWAFPEMINISNSYVPVNHSYCNFAELNGKIYFTAIDSIRRNKIWETDGTAQGTKVIKIFASEPINGYGLDVAANNGRLYTFVAPSNTDFGMYLTDCTVNGTYEICHLCNALDYYVSHAHNIYMSGRILFVNDGTRTGTAILDSNAHYSADYVTFNNYLYFFTHDGRNKLFKTDGTTAGTQVVKDSLKHTDWSSNYLSNMILTLDNRSFYPVVFDNNIYFCGVNEIWKSDGTNTNTKIFKAFPYNTPYAYAFSKTYPTNLTVANGKLYFKGLDSSRVELFVTDGTAAGTHAIKSKGANFVDSGFYANSNAPPATLSSSTDAMIVFNNHLYFTGFYDSSIGKGLYRLDYTAGLENPPAMLVSKLSIFPNPSHGIINISYPKSGYTAVSVSDCTGRIVYAQKTATGQDVLDLSSLPSGAYFLQVSGQEPPISAPVIIQR